MMKSSTFKLTTAVVVTACFAMAAPAFAGKNSTPGVTTATTSLSAVPPAASATIGGGSSSGSYAIGSTVRLSPVQADGIRSLPSARTVIRDGEEVTEITVRLENGDLAVVVLSADNVATVVAQ